MKEGSGRNADAEIRELKRERKKYRKYLIEVTEAVMKAISAINVIGKPMKNDAGRDLAKVANFLEIQNDSARYFGLGVDYRKDKKPRGITVDALRATPAPTP